MFSVTFCSSHAHPRVRAEKKMSVREQDYQVGFNIILQSRKGSGGVRVHVLDREVPTQEFKP